MLRGLAPLVDTDVLKHFRMWSGVVPAGYFAYCLGNLTRADYWAFPKEIRALYDRERFESFSSPAWDDNVFDLLVTLEAVVEATDSFTMIALGAGWGRWLIAAAFANRLRRNLPIRLIGVEAEPTHFDWMREHFRDNGLDPDEHELVPAAAAGASGYAWFHVGKADSWYGQSIVTDPGLPTERCDDERDYRGERVRQVRTVGLESLAARHSRIDYLHMDIQGAELEVLVSAPALLDRKVRRILVGTHSAEIEVGLRELFTRLRWSCQYDVPLNGEARIGETIVRVGDGVQVWINPTLEA
jgi:FkbM family methyltransferase